MNTIFWDLETTDLNPVGQILNFAFVEVDENWKEVSRFNDDVLISRTQLPMPRAILANRVDVLEHQKKAKLTEPQAMLAIRKYLETVIDKAKNSVLLIGYNSGKFDNNYLRTSCIRNGINPYFGKSIINADLKYVCSKLALVSEDFRKKLLRSDDKVHFTLEFCLKALDILKEDEKQTHNSLEDVLHTIELAKKICNDYKLDVRSYDAYEAVPREKYGQVLCTVYPDKDPPTRAKWTLLDRDKNYALWINLDQFAQGKRYEAIKWFNKAAAGFYIDHETQPTEDDLKLAEEAHKELDHIDLSNYFPEKNCDIEQHIYMMPFSEIDALKVAIWNKDRTWLKEINSKFGSKLYVRHLINIVSLNEDHSKKLLGDYALYRYGGRLKLSKFNLESTYEEGVYNEDFHVTFNELLEEIDKLTDEKTQLKLQVDVKLLESLRKFYLESEIYTVVGEELLKIKRVKK